MQSENVSHADNQQERLVKIGWVTGFVDGEGCFSVGFIQQKDKIEPTRIRRGYKTGYQVFYEFAVTQGEKSKIALSDLKDFFGIGNLYINKRYDNHKEHLWRYVVRKLDDLQKVIIPFFKHYKMHTSKQKDFLKFVECIEMVERREHMTKDGIIKIAKIAMTMNRQKPRESLMRILRDYTPTSHSV